jgi:hypothetical protein
MAMAMAMPMPMAMPIVEIATEFIAACACVYWASGLNGLKKHRF